MASELICPLTCTPFPSVAIPICYCDDEPCPALEPQEDGAHGQSPRRSQSAVSEPEKFDDRRVERTSCSGIFWSRRSCHREHQCNSEINAWSFFLFFEWVRGSQCDIYIILLLLDGFASFMMKVKNLSSSFANLLVADWWWSSLYIYMVRSILLVILWLVMVCGVYVLTYIMESGCVLLNQHFILFCDDFHL